MTLMPPEVQGHVLPFWKPPVNILWDLDCHWCCSTLNVCQAMLKNCIRVSRLMHRTVISKKSVLIARHCILLYGVVKQNPTLWGRKSTSQGRLLFQNLRVANSTNDYED